MKCGVTFHIHWRHICIMPLIVLLWKRPLPMAEISYFFPFHGFAPIIRLNQTNKQQNEKVQEMCCSQTFLISKIK